ncbi:MAG: hypothetical protein CM1200mP27_13060 [Chloroflexota bacterium]|nr:MAG: hypothetical protein CM1200mP27_13060 [Chloroflexota bacterium]
MTCSIMPLGEVNRAQTNLFATQALAGVEYHGLIPIGPNIQISQDSQCNQPSLAIAQNKSRSASSILNR